VKNESRVVTAYGRKAKSGLVERPISPSTLLELGIDDDDDVSYSDTQTFRTVGTASTGLRTITVTFTGGATTNPPKPSWSTSSGGGDCSGNANGSYTCTLDTASGAFTIIAARYNYQTSIRAKNETVSCPVGDARTFTFPGSTNNDIVIPACQNLAVDSVTVGGSVTKAFTTIPAPEANTDGLVGSTSGGWERTLLPFSDAPASGGTIRIALDANPRNPTPARFASCLPATGTVTNYTVGTCP
jgi:hypothetical protein